MIFANPKISNVKATGDNNKDNKKQIRKNHIIIWC